MTTPMLVTKVKEALKTLDLKEPVIEVDGPPGGWFVTVTSKSFSGIDEAERQRRVWQALRDSLDESERTTIEFVFTESPDDPIEAADDSQAQS